MNSQYLEESQIQDDQTTVNYQSEFEKHVDCNKKVAKSVKPIDKSAVGCFDSQTDVETLIKPFVTTNPNSNGTKVSKILF